MPTMVRDAKFSLQGLVASTPGFPVLAVGSLIGAVAGRVDSTHDRQTFQNIDPKNSEKPKFKHQALRSQIR